MSSLYYLGVGVISLGMGIYNFDVYGSGSSISCRKELIFNNHTKGDYCSQPNVTVDTDPFCGTDSMVGTEEETNTYRIIIIIIAIVYMVLLAMSIFLALTINVLSNQTPEDFIKIGCCKKFFACFCKIFPPIFIILSWVNFILIVVCWALIATGICEHCRSTDALHPKSDPFYYDKVKDLTIVNTIFWVILHYGGAIVRAMTYVEPYMYNPEVGNPHCCKSLLFKKLGP